MIRELLEEILRRRPLLREKEIPRPVFEYAKKISEITGLPLEKVLESEPVKNLIKKWEEKVKIG